MILKLTDQTSQLSFHKIVHEIVSIYILAIREVDFLFSSVGTEYADSDNEEDKEAEGEGDKQVNTISKRLSLPIFSLKLQKRRKV